MRVLEVMGNTDSSLNEGGRGLEEKEEGEGENEEEG